MIRTLHLYVRWRYRRSRILSTFREFDSFRLHSYESPPRDAQNDLLFLHGLGTSAGSWYHILPKLARNHHVVAPDLPGFGFSTVRGNGEKLSIPFLTSSVIEATSSILRRPYTLVGHSLGGWIALRLAAHNQQRVRKLILVNPAGILHEGMEDVRTAFVVKTVEQTRQLMERMWHSYPWYFRPFLPSVHREILARNVPSFVNGITESDFVNDMLSSLTIPVTVIWGEEDRLLPCETLSIMKNAVPTARIRFIPRCGHIPQLERPGELLRMLQEECA